MLYCVVTVYLKSKHVVLLSEPNPHSFDPQDAADSRFFHPQATRSVHIAHQFNLFKLGARGREFFQGFPPFASRIFVPCNFSLN